MAGNEQLQINPPQLTSRRIYDYGWGVFTEDHR